MRKKTKRVGTSYHYALKKPEMTYDEWEAHVPDSITQDPLWNMVVYRKALFLGDIAWADVTRLARDARTVSLADQLYRAVGSIDARRYTRKAVGRTASGSTNTHSAPHARVAVGTGRDGMYWPRR